MARALPHRPLNRGPFILLVLLTMAPDADFLLKFISDTTYLEHHRGLTHSLLMLPLWSWLAWAGLRRWQGEQTLSPLLIGAALLMHIMLDLITSFGTMILAPLSDWRAALDLVYIVDPLFSACLLLPLLIGLFWKRRRRALAVSALVLMCAYLIMATLAHRQALAITRSAWPEADSVAALPMPFSPFHWQLIASYPGHYQRCSLNLWPHFSGTSRLFPIAFVQRYNANIHSAEHLQWQDLPAMSSLKVQRELPGMAFYRWFARFPVILEQDDRHIECGDLRFGAGVAGQKSAFRLRIDLGSNPKAWLIWRGESKSELTQRTAPFQWL
ncbi:metal-dependent hydrolase [Mariprofundus ferrooxydans]|uniref:metal-dependent hydrolase n=1 Tax=Mariprofundus ferrooxydans TaxID=314344 RepID=UPI0038B2CA87